MKCEMTSSVEQCALRARSTHGVHHAIVEVNIDIGVVLREVLVARVVPLVVDAVIGLTLDLIAHVVIVVFVVAILHRIFLYGRYTLYIFARTQPDHQLGTLATDAVLLPGHVASLYRPDTPQRLVVLPDESEWHVHWDDQEQAQSPQLHQHQAPKHQKPAQVLDRTHVDMD